MIQRTDSAQAVNSRSKIHLSGEKRICGPRIRGACWGNDALASSSIVRSTNTLVEQCRQHAAQMPMAAQMQLVLATKLTNVIKSSQFTCHHSASCKLAPLRSNTPADGDVCRGLRSCPASRCGKTTADVGDVTLLNAAFRHAMFTSPHFFFAKGKHL